MCRTSLVSPKQPVLCINIRADAKGQQRETQRAGEKGVKMQQAGDLTWKGPNKASAAGSNCSAIEWMRSRVSLERM